MGIAAPAAGVGFGTMSTAGLGSVGMSMGTGAVGLGAGAASAGAGLGMMGMLGAAMPIAGIALGVMNAFVSNKAAKAQARQQHEYMEQMIAAQNKAALEEMRENYGQLTKAENSVIAGTMQQSVEAQKQAAIAEGKINLMAAATGMGGSSVQDMFFQLQQQKGQNLSTLMQNQENALLDIQDQAENIYAATNSKLQRVRQVARPTGWSMAANLVSGGLQGYLSGSQMQSLSDDFFGITRNQMGAFQTSSMQQLPSFKQIGGQLLRGAN